MTALRAENLADNVISFPPKDAPAEGKAKGKARWITNDAAEFVNSLCPNHQYEFPVFDWCDANESRLLEKACATAFHVIRAAWDLSALDRIDPKQLTVSENRILIVIALKTLRFGKLLEKIPRKTFIEGDSAEDKLGFEIVPKSGLANSNLVNGLSSLKKKRGIGCIKADQHNGNDPSNIYCVQPIRQMRVQFGMYAEDALRQKSRGFGVDTTRCTELARHFKEEIIKRTRDIIREDEEHA